MIKNVYKHIILIIDFGSQYTQLIARCIRELGIYCEILAWNDTAPERIYHFNPSGIILSGGPDSTTKYNSPRVPQFIFEIGVPILGICYGMQTMVIQLGGCVKFANKREFGYVQVKIENDSNIIRGISDSFTSDKKPLLDVWMSHNDKVTIIPPDFITVASTKNCQFAIISNEIKHFYGVQFHPEVTHTRKGKHILKRFVIEICKCKKFWTSVKNIDSIIRFIRQQIGNDKVILGFSGGIDSSVTAVLLQRAIGKNLTCIFLDNGLLSLNEAYQVIDKFINQFCMNIIHINAEKRFLAALEGKNDPEVKRKIIGQTFVEVFYEEASKLENIKWLAQGTIYSDIIESNALVSGKINVIKSHHNVGGLPRKMNMNLIEPLKNFFKDEVREIGLELGIPYDLIYRHPFPGPGLGVRILGEVKKEYCRLLRQADSIFVEELYRANLYYKVSQAFTVFLPLHSVGIMGDNRKYEWIVSLRAVETIDFMTARWVRLPYDFLDHVSNRIINEIDGISRVVYDISDKPPATIEWE